MRKEALLAVKSLLSVLLRERSLRPQSTQKDSVLHETGTWLMLLSTVEGFLKDNDLLGTITGRGVDVQKLQRHLTNTRAWIVRWQTLAQQGQLTEQDYQRYVQYTDMILTKTSGTLDDVLKQEPVYRSRPQDWLRAAAAGLLMTVCGYTGLSMNAYAQDVADARIPGRGPPVAERRETRDVKDAKTEQRDYVAEFMKQVEQVKIPEGKTAVWYNNAGNDALVKKDFLTAAKLLYEAVRLDASLQDAHLNLGTLYFLRAKCVVSEDEQKQHYLSAVNEFGLTIEIVRRKGDMPKSTSDNYLRRCHTSIGMAYSGMRDSVNAIKHLSEAAKYGKLSENAQNLLFSLGQK